MATDQQIESAARAMYYAAGHGLPCSPECTDHWQHVTGLRTWFLNNARTALETVEALHPAPSTADVLADLERMRDQQTSYNTAESIRRAAFDDMVKRAADLIAGCKCRPGLLVPLPCDLHPEEDPD
jgi:hypothetical protein